MPRKTDGIEFEKYRSEQDRLYQSDFDKYMGELHFEGEEVSPVCNMSLR